MGSVGEEDVFQLSTKFLRDSGGVDYSMVPRKQRSAIKKRRRESINPPFPIIWEENHEPKEDVKHSRTKKSKWNKKKGRLTKDEKEVAETLHALADMFFDATTTNKPGTDNEPPETKSSTTANGDTASAAPIDESKKISSRVSCEAPSHSPKLVDSTSQFVKFQFLRDTGKTDLTFEKLPNTPGVLLDIRQKMPFLDMNRSDEQAATPIQVATPCAQYVKRSYHPKEERSFGSYQAPSLFTPRDPSSKTQVTHGLPAWLENAVCNSKTQVNKNSVGADKFPEVGVGSKAHWKRSSAHVYICRMINNLQVSEGNEGLQEKPSRLATFEGVRCMPIKSINPQKSGFLTSDGIKNTDSEKNSAEVQNAIFLNQQLPFRTSSVSCSSTKQGTDFLPLGAGVGQTSVRAGITGAGNSHGALKKFHVSYLQSQNHFGMPFSLPRNGYSSNFQEQTSASASQQAQVPPFLVNSLDKRVMEPSGQQFWPQQQKWPFQLQAPYNHGGVATPVLADWKHGARDSSSQLNYSQAPFPHAHSPKYQQHFSQPQQQFMAINSSIVLSGVSKLNHPLELQKRWFFGSTNL